MLVLKNLLKINTVQSYMSIENRIYYKKATKDNYVDYSDILNRTSIKQEIASILQNFEQRCSDIHFKKGIYIYTRVHGKYVVHSIPLIELQQKSYKHREYDLENAANLIQYLREGKITAEQVTEELIRISRFT